MVCSGRDRLRGRVEVDESYVGGEEKGAHGRQTEKKAIVAITIEIHYRWVSDEYGCVRCQMFLLIVSLSLFSTQCSLGLLY